MKAKHKLPEIKKLLLENGFVEAKYIKRKRWEPGHMFDFETPGFLFFKTTSDNEKIVQIHIKGNQDPGINRNHIDHIFHIDTETRTWYDEIESILKNNGYTIVFGAHEVDHLSMYVSLER